MNANILCCRMTNTKRTNSRFLPIVWSRLHYPPLHPFCPSVLHGDESLEPLWTAGLLFVNISFRAVKQCFFFNPNNGKNLLLFKLLKVLNSVTLHFQKSWCVYSSSRGRSRLRGDSHKCEVEAARHAAARIQRVKRGKDHHNKRRGGRK